MPIIEFFYPGPSLQMQFILDENRHALLYQKFFQKDSHVQKLSSVSTLTGHKRSDAECLVLNNSSL